MSLESNFKAGFGVSDDELLSPEDANKRAPFAENSENERNTDTPLLNKFGTDITARAEKELLDPVVGRSEETLRIAQILCRRKKNNPILIGQPGVGKSAVVEGLAQAIVKHQVPFVLQNKRVVALDMASVVAGTQFRGQFEDRLRKLILELKNNRNVILFIDEIHTMIGAGSAAGTLDAANILKPALARGDVQCIGATTIEEYRKTIEKDGALERRFQKVLLEPPTAEQTKEILKNLCPLYENYHGVVYSDDAIDACVSLTDRYVSDRFFPDKAIDVMDEVGSYVRLSNTSISKSINDKEQEIENLKQKKQEAALNQDYELAARLRDALSDCTKELKQMTQEWSEAQNQHRQKVTSDDVSRVVSNLCGIPVGRIMQDENDRLRLMPSVLSSQVISQNEAIDKLTRSIAVNRLGIKGHNRPIGTFLFVGPTGVGKTHLVKCLSKYMFDRNDALIRIDMSEYGEKYNTSRLIGAPPGYVGYDEGGQLTEKVRRHPYSVVLLDEIEKAHADVFNMLLQVMDEGRLTDGNGSTVDFRNTIIIMTSNIGTRQLGEFGMGVGFNKTSDKSRSSEEIIQKALRRSFSPEFLNRLDDIIYFNPLNSNDAKEIVKIQLCELNERLQLKGYVIQVNDALVDYLVTQGFEEKYGARSIKRAISEFVEVPICEQLMSHSMLKEKIVFELSEDGKHLTIQHD